MTEAATVLRAGMLVGMLMREGLHLRVDHYTEKQE